MKMREYELVLQIFGIGNWRRGREREGVFRWGEVYGEYGCVAFCYSLV